MKDEGALRLRSGQAQEEERKGIHHEVLEVHEVKVGAIMQL